MRATTQPGIEDLYREHALGLVRLALLLTDPGRVLAYLRTAVVNGSSSRYRRHLVARRLRPEPLAMVQSAEALVLAGKDRRALLVAVGALPRRQREVLALKYFLDLGEQEIAAILCISRGAVASTASRALTAPARQFREES